MTQLALDLYPAVLGGRRRGPERIGGLVERELLEALRRALPGWEIPDPVPAFAGEGVLVIARRGPFEVHRQGASLADVAGELVREASLLNGAC